jgi:P4 family phage/plasmid primase-like protien
VENTLKEICIVNIMAQVYKRGEFCSYLGRYKVEKGSEHTHTSIFKPSGSFYIPADELEMFYQMYQNALLGGEDLFMTEKHRDMSPFLIDLDFRFERYGNELERKYTHKDVEAVIQVYLKKSMEYLQLTQPCHVYLLEKPYPTFDKGLVKDGIHIIIPDIVTRPSVQHLIRKDILPEVKSALETLGCVNSIEDIVDEAVIERNNWQMYGSKKPNCEAYAVTCKYIFDPSTSTLSKDALFIPDHSQLVETLSIRNKYERTGVKIEKETHIKEFEQAALAKKKSKMQANNMLQTSANNRRNEATNLEHIGKLVDILSPERANSYNDWIRVGWCLRNIDHRLLDKWIEFSMKSPKFQDDNECRSMWRYMRDGGIGVGTLYMWAKQDNPEEYKNIMQHDITTLIYNSTNETHFDIARVVHLMFKHEFVCASIKQNAWYQFREHRWVDCESGHSLSTKLSTDVFRQYSLAAALYHSKAAATESETEQRHFSEVGKKLAGIATKLKTVSYKENVMSECRRMFYTEKFEEKLDSKCQLIGFDNGVYDLEAKEFREGQPEDFISFTTGCNYIEYQQQHGLAKQVQGFLNQVLTKPHIKEYVLLLLSSFLNGNIREERFHIWTGSGCFAKDTPIMMFDGSSKSVQDVIEGDRLMGDDSTPRTVQQLFNGYSDMYEITPIKGDKFTVNGGHDLVVKIANMTYVRQIKDGRWTAEWAEYDQAEEQVIKVKKLYFQTKELADAHVATLDQNPKNTKKGDILIMTVHQYLRLSKTLQSFLYLYRPEIVNYPSQDVKIDPWFLGYWLGNGSYENTSFTTMDTEVYDEVVRLYGEDHEIPLYDARGVANTWAITWNKNRDCLWHKFMHYNLKKNKHIPEEYMHNDKNIRMRLLAGIIDSDGHYQESANHFEVTFEKENLLDDLIVLARSLGFTCFKYIKVGTWTHNGVKKSGTYYRTHICGHGLENIPTVVPRKKAKARTDIRNPLVFSFKLERVADGDFYGFELDGNRRFLKGNGDFTVLKNSNGKSKIIDLFEQSFGDYCCKFPVTLLTQKRGASGAAAPELARSKGKRFAVLQEPSEDEKLNVGLMKELSGGDKIQARALFKDCIEFKPQFKMVLTCNHLPNVPSDDGGTWRRIRLVEFTSKFTQNPDPAKETEFPIDVDLSSKFVDWREHFMTLLIEYYKKYCTTGITEPEEVLKCTKEYQRNNDFYLDFVENELEVHDMSFVSVNDAYSVFKSWTKDNMPSLKVKKGDFMKSIDKICGKRANINRVEGWKGYRVKTFSSMDMQSDAHDDLN